MISTSTPEDAVSLREKAASAAIWTAAGAWTFGMLGGLAVLQQFIPADKMDFLGRLYCRTTLALTGSRWRAFVHPDVEADKPYMFVQNHTNHFDHVTLYNATPHFKQGLELEAHFKYPVYGWFMKSRGTIPVRKNARGREQQAEILEAMRREVERGHSILAFPEGTRTRDGRVGRFRKGVFYMARDLNLPIVPVAVTGMYEVMRKGSWIIRPGHDVTVHVEQPISTTGITDAQIPALIARTRSIISTHVDAHRERVHQRDAEPEPHAAQGAHP